MKKDYSYDEIKDLPREDISEISKWRENPTGIFVAHEVAGYVRAEWVFKGKHYFNLFKIK